MLKGNDSVSAEEPGKLLYKNKTLLFDAFDVDDIGIENNKKAANKKLSKKSGAQKSSVNVGKEASHISSSNERNFNNEKSELAQVHAFSDGSIFEKLSKMAEFFVRNSDKSEFGSSNVKENACSMPDFSNKTANLIKLNLTDNENFIPGEVSKKMQDILGRLGLPYCLLHGGAVRDYLISSSINKKENVQISIESADYDFKLPVNQARFFVVADYLNQNSMFYKKLDIKYLSNGTLFEKPVSASFVFLDKYYIDISFDETLPNVNDLNDVILCESIALRLEKEDLVIGGSAVLIPVNEKQSKTLFTLPETFNAIKELKLSTFKDPEVVIKEDMKRLFRFLRISYYYNYVLAQNNLEIRISISSDVSKAIDALKPNLATMNLSSLINQLAKIFERLGVVQALKLLANENLKSYIKNMPVKFWINRDNQPKNCAAMWRDDDWVSLGDLLNYYRQIHLQHGVENVISDTHLQVFAQYALKFNKHLILSFLWVNDVDIANCLNLPNSKNATYLWYEKPYKDFFSGHCIVPSTNTLQLSYFSGNGTGYVNNNSSSNITNTINANPNFQGSRNLNFVYPTNFGTSKRSPNTIFRDFNHTKNINHPPNNNHENYRYNFYNNKNNNNDRYPISNQNSVIPEKNANAENEYTNNKAASWKPK
ncbi:MAG: hypothetical protein Tsb005_16460 [Gammaproteobacteria bacterium]